MSRSSAGEILYEGFLSEVGRSLKPNAIRRLTRLLGRTDVISLAAGAPSAETFPSKELAELSARVIRDNASIALQYGPTRGQPLLVQSVVSILESRGIPSTPEQVVVTTGSQQGLDLAARILIDPGDVALVELPSYIGGTIALYNSRAHLIGVSQDSSGINVDELRATIKRTRSEGRTVKCVYTIPNFHNPSGVSVAAGRREALVDIADEFDLIIIEDDPYFDLYFGEPNRNLRPIAALRPERVIYLSSFSKVLAPGLRCAYVSAPPELASRIELVKEGSDLSSSLMDQAIVAEALREGLVEKRLPWIRSYYEERCIAMIESLRHKAPASWKWTTPTGGFFIMLEAQPELDTIEKLEFAIENGVAYVPGSPFFVDGSGKNRMRLAFSKENPERIREGISRLCRILAPK